ncbi:LysR family transcriptional regulator [Inhella sp. 1Y17]|uniref:LysR family transcriptional regulator n=2 Tax=Inhella proteolytica TaxID=2795029 RepID=A0A931J6S4_9BURK|nr:LysR family transcriptional regulator [Inhella proteolytica]
MQEAMLDFVQRRLTLRHLRVLEAMHATGKLSAAADLLNVTQPAVSKTLSELEKGLGQTLFARSKRGLHATVLGERLIALGRRLEGELQRSSDEMRTILNGALGELQIGATNAALPQVLPDALAAMKKAHPLITLTVRTHALSDLIGELRQGRLDLVLARLPPHEMPADLEGQMLMRQPEVLVISTQHPLAQQRHWSWDALQGEAWIGHLPGTRTRALHDRLWAKLGLPPPANQIVCGDAMLSLALLRRMPLLAILSRPLARFAAQQGLVRILPLEADLGLAELSVWHLRSPQSPWVAEFKRLLASAAREVEAA